MNVGTQRLRWLLRHSRWRRWIAWVMLVLGVASTITNAVELATGSWDESAAIMVLSLLGAIVVLLAGAFSVWLIYTGGSRAGRPPPPMPTVSPERMRAFRIRVIIMSCVIITAGIVTVVVGVVRSTPPSIVTGVVATVAGVLLPLRIYRLLREHNTP